MEKTSTVKLLKNNTLKEAQTNYSIFSDDVLELSKAVDKPSEYYVVGDEITFTIIAKNIGDKTLKDFTITDELENDIKPFANGFKVLSSLGQITSYLAPITIEKITLNPNESVEIQITGLIQ